MPVSHGPSNSFAVSLLSFASDLSVGGEGLLYMQFGNSGEIEHSDKIPT